MEGEMEALEQRADEKGILDSERHRFSFSPFLHKPNIQAPICGSWIARAQNNSTPRLGFLVVRHIVASSWLHRGFIVASSWLHRGCIEASFREDAMPRTMQ
jgi:hypothetical protein